MTDEDEVWRPLGMDDESGAAAYDALHDGVPVWMDASLWEWIEARMVIVEHNGVVRGGSRRFNMTALREVERVLHYAIGLKSASTVGSGMAPLKARTKDAGKELALVDFLLQREPRNNAAGLDKVLEQSGSAWKVGVRAGRAGLVRRVPEGAQVAADHVIASAGKAGRTLARAWEAAYGVEPDPSRAYALAVRAVEDAAIPYVTPGRPPATTTLGDVIRKLRDDGDWSLPLMREHPQAPTSDIVRHMCMALFKGHHDRHGDGDESKPDDVSQAEAEAAVTMAVALVQWFSAQAVARRPQQPQQ